MLDPDTTIAHYRIETLIGVGGMGEVYKAIDMRLGRAVALKVLPTDLNRSPERIRRFVQEAKAASSLNHPNILTVYDAGQVPSAGDEQVHFMVSELVDGKTLRELIHRDRIPLKRVVGYLAQAADGIAKAHAAGIVHRDLKPDNIMVTSDGFAKVLDFGLAKLTETTPSDSAQAGETRTREGLIVGTVAYMSPEQAQARPVDHRSDVFAFGAIVYEAAARKPAFSGDSDPDILHRIIHDEPSPLGEIPAELDRLVSRALAKDPEERIQSMKDVALELRDISRSYDGLRLTKRARRRISLRTSAWLAITALGLLAGGATGYLLNRQVDVRPPILFSMSPPEGTRFAGTPNSATALQFALSPDGRKIVFVATGSSGVPQLWLRELDSLEPRLMSGTERAFFPFWSPDGLAVGFFADEKLKRTQITGGTPIVLANAPDPRGGSWSKDGVILFGTSTATSIFRIPAAGGEAVEAVALDRKRLEHGHRWPYFLPDGRHFLFLVLAGNPSRTGIRIGSLDSSETTTLVRSDSRAEFVAPDQILFMRNGALYTQRVDRRTFATIGAPVLVERQVGYAPTIRYGAFSVAGDVIAWARWMNPNRRLTWIDRDGRTTPASEPADWGTTSLSLFGTRALLTRADPDVGNLDVWSVDLSRGISSRMTTDEGDDNHPVWSPDGSSFVFTSSRAGVADMYLKKPGVTVEERLTTNAAAARPRDWSMDGRYVIFTDRSTGKQSDVSLLPMNPRGAPRPFVHSPFNESDGVVSPDGRWLAYVSDESGQEDVYVEPFPAEGDPYRVSFDGGSMPKWSHDGRELFFITPKAELVTVRRTGTDTQFEVSRPRVLFRIPGFVAALTTFRTAYAVGQDGRFLFTVTPSDSPAAPINVALNWRVKTH